MKNDKRLIEDYLPIKAISAEASREKSIRKGHISTLHLWWARRPLVACRAAVYGALVPADQFQPQNGPESKKGSLGRANAARFLEKLCQYPGHPQVIKEAERHILEAHAQRLTEETGQKVTREDIEAGRAPRPKVLDMFAGGGAIPLEALRMGCEAYALDLNPVAYIILLCTLVYPQKYGKPDPNAQGMTGPPGPDGKPTWGGLAKEVRYWGDWVLKKVKAEIGDLYPLIPDPKYKGERPQKQQELWLKGEAEQVPPGYLMPVAYLWTRTVACKNPACGATVPLVRQTWLCKSKGRYVAMKILAPAGEKHMLFEVVEAATEKGLGFDPTGFSSGGNATCPFCGTVADSAYVKAEGCAKRMGQQLMAIVCINLNKQGKIYLSAQDVLSLFSNEGRSFPSDKEIINRINILCSKSGITAPIENIEANPRSMDIQHYGFETWVEIYSNRQLLSLLSFADKILHLNKDKLEVISQEYAVIIKTFLALILDRLADFNSSLCVHNYFGSSRIAHTFGRQSLPMV